MSLPEYGVTRLHVDTEDGSCDMLAVVCPRCQGEFWVNGGSWRAACLVGDPPRLIVGRSCTYCFKTAAVPEGLLLAPVEPKPKPSRIVRRRKS